MKIAAKLARVQWVVIPLIVNGKTMRRKKSYGAQMREEKGEQMLEEKMRRMKSFGAYYKEKKVE